MSIKLAFLPVVLLVFTGKLNVVMAAEAQCHQEFKTQKSALDAQYGKLINTKEGKSAPAYREYQTQVTQAQGNLNTCLKSPAVVAEKSAIAEAAAKKKAEEAAARAAEEAAQKAAEEKARAAAATKKAICMKNCPNDPVKRAACQARC